MKFHLAFHIAVHGRFRASRANRAATQSLNSESAMRNVRIASAAEPIRRYDVPDPAQIR
ncbi:hypothetical protein GCM10027289_03250 [Tsukamurella serpentis]